MIDDICCDSIHDELINIEEAECPFCNKILIECEKTNNICCEDHNISDINGIKVCIECGEVHSTIYKDDDIDFYENVFRIKRKSIYNRKYHIMNIINNLLIDHGVRLSYYQQVKIKTIFRKIGCILPQVNNGRKRIISTNFLMKKIFDMMDLKYPLSITKSPKTLVFYNEYWDKIMSLIGDKIDAIIDE